VALDGAMNDDNELRSPAEGSGGLPEAAGGPLRIVGGPVTDAPVLKVSNVSKRYGGVNALSDVSLTLHAGEVVALVGDNGAGKSTFVKVISGIERADAGTMESGGAPVLINSPQAAAAVGIQTVYQDLALCDTLDTVQNLFLGRELRRPWYQGFRLSRAEMEKTTQRVLSNLGATIKNLSTPVGALSGGQRQAAAICRAVLTEPRVVILDEPTAALGVAQRAEVLSLIRQLRNRGVAVLVISHDLHEIEEAADRVIVFRLGRIAAEMHRGGFTQQELVAAIMGGKAKN
jgi:D-xylose transport system ATP-binding protein